MKWYSARNATIADKKYRKTYTNVSVCGKMK